MQGGFSIRAALERGMWETDSCAFAAEDSELSARDRLNRVSDRTNLGLGFRLQVSRVADIAVKEEGPHDAQA